MKSISLKLDDAIFGDTEKLVGKLNIPRNRYINEALDYYNRVQQRKLLAKTLQKESYNVREESLRVLNDLDGIDYGD